MEKRDGSRVLDEAPVERRPRALLVAVVSLLTLVFGVLGLRLGYIQVLSHERWKETAAAMRSGRDVVASARGDIRTRDNVVLARSVQTFDVGVDPSRFRSEEGLVLGVQLACDVLELPGEVRRRRIDQALRTRRAGGRYVRLARSVDSDVVDRIADALARTSGVEAGALTRSASARRLYPRGDLLGAVVGVTDPDGRGIEGVERQLDAYLSGRQGSRQVIRDASQRMRIYYPENSDVAPIHGYDVVLTIDSRVQRILDEELAAGIARTRAEAGLGIVMDCRGGDVLALSSWPRYDPNEYHRYPAAERQLRRKNRPVESTFEPGSVLKPFVVAMGLELGLASRGELVWGGGKSRRFEIGGRSRMVTDTRDHGPLTLDDTLIHSSNIGMAIIGQRLGRDRLIGCLERFGFGRPAGIELPGEAPGWRQSEAAWKELYTTISVSFGYEVRVTPLQLCAAFAALVNGGNLYRPRLVDHLVRDGEEHPAPRVLLGHPVSEATSRELREMLLRVVADGTARNLQMAGFRFGGKSGTSDIGATYTKQDYLSSFEAFAPYEAPEVVVLVMIERPRGKRYYGTWVAGPIVAQVLRRHFRVEAEPKMAMYD